MKYAEHVAGRCEALVCAGLTRFRITDQSDPRLADAQAICPTGAVVGNPGNRSIDDAACIRCGACMDLAPRAIRKEAAPVGTALPNRAPANPPGLGPAHGVVPLSWQAHALARPEGAHGGPPPLINAALRG